MFPGNEVEDGLELLYNLDLRERVGAELIACPTCGRIQVDLFTLTQDVRKKLKAEIDLPIKVAVMGCVVNGPGEAEGADVAIFAGDRRGIIYVQGEKVANVPEEDILESLLDLLPDVLESAVIGCPHPDLGEAVIAVIVPEDGKSPSEQIILDQLSDQLARFKHPRKIIFQDALPRNSMGKVQKNILRQNYSDLFG